MAPFLKINFLYRLVMHEHIIDFQHMILNEHLLKQSSFSILEFIYLSLVKAD